MQTKPELRLVALASLVDTQVGDPCAIRVKKGLVHGLPIHSWFNFFLCLETRLKVVMSSPTLKVDYTNCYHWSSLTACYLPIPSWKSVNSIFFGFCNFIGMLFSCVISVPYICVTFYFIRKIMYMV